MTLLAQLQGRGLRVTIQGDALLVEPRSALTDEMRAMIRANKRLLLRELAGKGESLPADLDRRIRLMGRRWQYTEAELAAVVDLARCDPIGWAMAVDLDERKFGSGETLSRPDA